jgi:hypothetical protein
VPSGRSTAIGSGIAEAHCRQAAFPGTTNTSCTTRCESRGPVARASRWPSPAEPGGSLRAVGAEPFVFRLERGGSIDPSPLVDADGTAHLLWMSDDNALDQPSSMWLQPFIADGRAVTGAPTELQRRTYSSTLQLPWSS